MALTGSEARRGAGSADPRSTGTGDKAAEAREATEANEVTDGRPRATRAAARAVGAAGAQAGRGRRRVLVPGAEVERRARADRARTRGRVWAIALATLALALFSLCEGISSPGTLYAPAQVLGCYAGWLRLHVVAAFVPAAALDEGAIVAALPMYYEVTARVAYTVVTLACGAMLAVSGMLYQLAFRNPIAAPAMLGVSSGAQAAVVALVAGAGAQAAYLTGTRYLYSIVGGLAAMALVLALGALASGRGRGLDMVSTLLIGTIVSSAVGAVSGYVVNYLFDDAQWLAWYAIANVTDLDVSGVTFALLGAALLVALAPVVALRFRLNALSFPDPDARALGVRPLALRALAMACGSVMILVAQALCGAVSMVSLVVPFAARAVFGVEFRRQLAGSVWLGALALMACRDVASLIPLAGTGVPLGSVATIVLLPAFAWVMVAAQRQWAR
ncbi:iron ABC transporter permease [bacterium]|nr:iron ABC transporter permease [bacterium]